MKTKPPQTLFRLHISLSGSNPQIWRRLLVPSGITLGKLHKVLQAVMGWHDCHLHEFISDGELYGIPFPDDGFGHPVKDERRKKLSSLLKTEHDSLRYLYDPGDDWGHLVTLESIVQDDGSTNPPRCIGGAGACPPEDCGGLPGYAYLLEVLCDPDHPDYREMKAWAGGKFDPSRFDPKSANRKLARFR